MRNHDSMGASILLSPSPFISDHCHGLAQHKLT